jgi:hypothetical protein
MRLSKADLVGTSGAGFRHAPVPEGFGLLPPQQPLPGDTVCTQVHLGKLARQPMVKGDIVYLGVLVQCPV